MQETPRPIRAVSFKTLGCKLNQSEADTLQAQFRAAGYEVRPFGEPVDLTVINTCLVTREAESKSRAVIRRALRVSPGTRIAVTGCYSQVKPEAVRALEGVDLILGNTEKYNLLKYLDKLQAGKLEEPLVFIDENNEATLANDEGFISATQRTRAFLKIQEGCDYHCTYCIIPAARGRARSRSMDSCVAEAERLVTAGYPELVLTGINIGTYKAPESDRVGLLPLLERLAQIPGLKRVRLSSLEPNTITADLLRFIKDTPVICPHLHVPLQSGSDRILRAMGRFYSAAEFSRSIELIHRYLPDAALGSDVMVGFPGETDADFQDSYNLLRDLSFTYLHIFRYSPREGTPAAVFQGAVSPAVARERSARLRDLGARLKKNFMQRFLGRTQPVLVESQSDRQQLTGYTPHYLRVYFPGPESLIGRVVPVELEAVEGEAYLGRLRQDSYAA